MNEDENFWLMLKKQSLKGFIENQYFSSRLLSDRWNIYSISFYNYYKNIKIHYGDTLMLFSRVMSPKAADVNYVNS